MILRRVFSMLHAAPTDEVRSPIVNIEQVRAEELSRILGLDAGDTVGKVETWGLALSGGGIRSATFALGVLQTLAREGLLRCFHYQSTVSGGGYIGAFLQGLLQRHGFEVASDALRSTLRDQAVTAQRMAAGQAVRPGFDEQLPIQRLREYSNYLSPRKSPFSGDSLGMIGTYVRNVLLIQLQLCALILALSLTPLLLYWLASSELGGRRVLTLVMAGVFGLVGAILLGYVSTSADRRPAETRPGKPLQPRIAVAAMLSIVCLGIGSFVGAMGLAHFNRMPPIMDVWFDSFAPSMGMVARLGWSTAALYLAIWLLWMAVDLRRTPKAKSASDPCLRKHLVRFVAGTVGASLFAGAAMVATHWIIRSVLMDDLPIDQIKWQGWSVMIVGSTLVMVAVTLTGIIHLGLVGPALSDLQREIWARVGGKTAGMVVFGISLPIALAVLGPWAIYFASSKVWGSLGWTGVLTWLSTTGIGLLAAHSQLDVERENGNWRTWLMDRIARIAPWVFILGLLVAVSLAGHALLGAVTGVDRPIAGSNLNPMQHRGAYLQWLDDRALVDTGWVALIVISALSVWVLFGLAVNVNDFSLNAFYRNRLVRCYLGASNETRRPEPTTNFDTADDIPLKDIAARQPGQPRPLYPLVCCALNLVAARQLDWQDRKAASFVLSPGFCGYLPPATRIGARQVGDISAAAGAALPGHDTERLADALTLGSAMAISGAAVSPNMGYHSSPAVTFLLTLFDARLGWWLPNPSHHRRPSADQTPFFGRLLLAELLGRTHDGGKYVHLSDGGHFENLGLYELVRRRCRFILSVDATADPTCEFADLGNAVRKCRVDFGADIDIDVSAMRSCPTGASARSCAMGTITYADGSEGTLLYVKPVLVGSEPADIAHYASCHASFPHEPTSDQFFDEAQFESYRRLGEVVASRAIRPALERAGQGCDSRTRADFDIHDTAIKGRFIAALKRHWVAPLPGVSAHFSKHGQAMSQLFARLRENASLTTLDAQIYPAWGDLLSSSSDWGERGEARSWRQPPMPEKKHFRACFYFCQELIQMMEAVYHDLDLENAWDHPDNRGWMNAFHHWSWAPMFRISWMVGAPTFGARFVAFCEMRLDLPRMRNEDKLRHPFLIRKIKPLPGESWNATCDRLREEGRINLLEHGLLLSEALCKRGQPPTALYLMCIRWDRLLVRASINMPETTVGVAAIAVDTLRVFRVQDHVRRLGLGAEFLRLLDSVVAIRKIDIHEGHYGAVGIVGRSDAERMNSRLQALLERTRQLQQARSSARRAKADP